jgi:hypothetical protein
MRFRISFALVLVALSIAPAGAQRRASIPPSVARDIETLHNAPGSRREIASVTIGASDVVAASLVVRNGPATISGHIQGSLVGVNANITLLPGARIDGDIIVVGGQVDGRSDARIGGDVRIYSETLRYSIDGDRLTVEGIETRTETGAAALPATVHASTSCRWRRPARTTASKGFRCCWAPASACSATGAH